MTVKKEFSNIQSNNDGGKQVTDWKTLTLKISPEEHKQIKRLSVETGRTIKDLMMECFKRLVREYEESQKG